MQPKTWVLSALVLASLGVSRAGVLTGRLVDDLGRPVANAVFQFQPTSGGGLPTVTGGFSDSNGFFHTTVTPNGSYDMTVFPPAPPTSYVVTRRIDAVLVSDTPNDLGVQELEVGVSLKGRVVNSLGTPLVSVGLEFVAAPDFQPLDFSNGETDNTGHFHVAAPHGSVLVRYKPGVVPYYGGPDTAATKREYLLTSDSDVGDVVMPQGYTLTGRVLDSSTGNAVKDAEIEAVNLADGDVLYVPDNRTSDLGFFLVTIPAGTYDLTIVPKASDDLGPKVLADVTVPPGRDLGTIQLDPGFELRGRIEDRQRNRVQGATVQLVDVNTGRTLKVDGNTTDQFGDYRVMVPGGVFDVVLSAPFSLPLGRTVVRGVVIDRRTNVDATLPKVDFFTTEGAGNSGTGGFVPQIASDGGTPRLGNLGYTAVCSQAMGGTIALVEVTLGDGADSGAPFGGDALGGTGRVFSYLRTSGVRGDAGAGETFFRLPIPVDHKLVGEDLHVRFHVFDPAAAGGVASTSTLVATIRR